MLLWSLYLSIGTMHSGLPVCNYYCPDQPPTDYRPTLSRTWDGQHWAGSVLFYMCTPGVNFINILRATFLYKCILHSSLALYFFYQKKIGAKAACKMFIIKMFCLIVGNFNS
jgi:hypothetical protein